MVNQLRHGLFALGLILCAPMGSVQAQEVITSERYVDATGGDDANDGTSDETAWQTLDKVGAATFGPGGAILFKAGEEWDGRLLPQGSGAEGAPILIDRYGDGPNPALHGHGAESVILLFNQEFWEISNLEITNFEAVAEGETPTRKRAIHIAARDMGRVQHIHLKNLVIHDVNSEMETFDSRYYGGIFLQIAGSTTPTWFDGILVEGCHLYDVDRTAISNDSSWWERGPNSSFGEPLENTGTGPDRTDRWVASENVIIRKNRLEHIGGNGVIVRVSRKALVEHNEVFHAGEEISGNGMFCFNTDSTFFQFNEVAYTVYNDGDTDARGIDSDYRTKHTIIQYNYLHHNGYGGVVATGGPGGATSVPRFNIGTIIRYNILVDNVDHIVRASGNLSEMKVYNNVIYTSDDYPDRRIDVVVHGSWSGALPDDVGYYNNVFLTPGAHPVFTLGNSTNNEFDHNLFWGQEAVNQPHDPGKVEADPQLVNPVTTDGWDELEGFRLESTSPAISAGRSVEGAPAHDFFGNTVEPGRTDIGIHQTGPSVGVEHEARDSAPDLVVFPNPAGSRVSVIFSSSQAGTVTLQIFDLIGREVASRDYSVALGHARLDLDLSELALSSGLYQLRLLRDGNLVNHASLLRIGL